MALRLPTAAPDLYSTSETDTGRIWIDGRKIFRKVVNFGTLPNATSKQVPHGITGISNFVLVRAFSGGTPIPALGGATSDYMTVWSDTTNIGIWCGGNKSASTAIVVLEYTKT